MYSNFLESLIYQVNNQNLKDGDLLILSKLHPTYNVIRIAKIVLHEDLDTILSYLIVNELPFYLGVTKICDNGKLFSNIVHLDRDNLEIKVNSSSLGSPLIYEHVKKMNDLITNAS